MTHTDMPLRGHLVCGGRFHDFDYARLRLLNLLAEQDDVQMTVSSDFSDIPRIGGADFLITYTCDVRPSVREQQVLREVIARGRWLALHGTNALFDVGRHGATPRTDAPWLMDLLGSRLLAHPPLQPFEVQVTDPGHPLVEGIAPFVTDDELYLCDVSPDVQVLLHAEFDGTTPGWADEDWEGTGPHPLAYLYDNVYYVALGHCRGHFDMRPLADWYPHIERGAWERPEFEELLRRAIAWASTRLPQEERNDH